MSDALTAVVLLAAVGLLYVGVWEFWARRRLVVLRREAVSLRYRVPRRLLALYLLGTLLAPLTAVVVAVAWLYARARRLSHSWKQA